MRLKMILSYTLLGLFLINYQSCAPSNEAFDPELQGHIDTADVDGIDTVAVGGIAFPQSKMSAFMDQELVAVGVCQQSGALISWKLSGANGVIERGLAECQTGSFEVAVGNDWHSHCGEALTLSANLGAKAETSMKVEGNCQ